MKQERGQNDQDDAEELERFHMLLQDSKCHDQSQGQLDTGYDGDLFRSDVLQRFKKTIHRKDSRKSGYKQDRGQCNELNLESDPASDQQGHGVKHGCCAGIEIDDVWFLIFQLQIGEDIIKRVGNAAQYSECQSHCRKADVIGKDVQDDSRAKRRKKNGKIVERFDGFYPGYREKQRDEHRMQKQQHGCDPGVQIFQRGIKAQIRGCTADDPEQCECIQHLRIHPERFSIPDEDPCTDDHDRKEVLVECDLNRMSPARYEGFRHHSHQRI